VPGILVIRHGALGDIAQTFAPLQAIRRHHAGAKLVFLTSSPYADLMRRCPWVDEVWVDDRPKLAKLGAWIALRQRIRAARFERVYDLQLHARTNWYFQMLLPGPRPEWVGIARGCSHPHTNPARDRLHNEDRQAEQLALAGIREIPPPDLSWLDADLSPLGLPTRFALLVPGTSAHRAVKRWPTENFAAVARFLAAHGVTPVVIGGRGEGELAAVIRAACPQARDLTGRTGIAEIAALGRKAAVAVGNDTGPMHLVAETRAPTVMLMSRESDPDHCAPRGPRARWLRRDAIADLPVAEVEAALAALLALPVPSA
jgi:ADP-heptose:LPS heptosyltransferase